MCDVVYLLAILFHYYMHIASCDVIIVCTCTCKSCHVCSVVLSFCLAKILINPYCARD